MNRFILGLSPQLSRVIIGNITMKNNNQTKLQSKHRQSSLLAILNSKSKKQKLKMLLMSLGMISSKVRFLVIVNIVRESFVLIKPKSSNYFRTKISKMIEYYFSRCLGQSFVLILLCHYYIPMSIKYTSFESIKFSYIIDIMGACVGQKQIPQKRSTKRTSQQKFQTQIPRPQKAGPSKIDNQKGIVLSQKLRKMRQKFPSFWINPRKIKGQPKIKWEKMNESTYYKGQWKGNIMHGQGQVFINKNGQQRLAFVVFQEGRPQTSTVKILDSYGGYYEGPINQILQPHGTGVYRNQEIGLVLQGQFLNGVPSGKIKQKCKQYVFEGQYKNGHKASGKMRDSKGEYQGDFAPASQKSQFFQDIKQGHGKYKWQNGGTYIGQWQCDSPHGVGKLYDAENSLVRKGKWYFGQMAAPQVTKNRPPPSKLIMNSL